MRPLHRSSSTKGRALSFRKVLAAGLLAVCVVCVICTLVISGNSHSAAAANAEVKSRISNTAPSLPLSPSPQPSTTATSTSTSTSTSSPNSTVQPISATPSTLASLVASDPPVGTNVTSLPSATAEPDQHRNASLVETTDPFTGSLEEIPLPPDWYECVRRFLMLDVNGTPTRDVLDMDGAIPVLITPLTGETYFLPRFLCSIDVPVRYYVVIMNERDKPTVEVVNELQRRFGDSGRLIVRRNRYNRGYSGSMNQGIEWAMTERSNAQAPWFFACNVDIVFGNHILRDMVELIANRTAGDEAMLQSLQEEVEMEQRLVEEGNFSYYDRYVPPGRPLKVLRSGYPGVPLNVRTAPLLPDRIRYMHTHENRLNGVVSAHELRARYFGKYVGTVTPVIDALGSIALTRLFVSTVGYFDENYFPAYMDDIDLQWRMYAFGFQRLHAGRNEKGRPVWYHYNAANMRGRPDDAELFRRSNEDNMSRHAFLKYWHRRGDEYDILKYGVRDRAGVWRQTPEKSSYTHTFFNVDKYPLDTWVMDDEVRICMFRKTFNYDTQQWQRPDRCVYRPAALRDSGVLSQAQLQQLSA